MESFGGEDIDFSKDEIVDGAIYRVNLKKIRYDSSFKQSDYLEESKARLRWKLEEKRSLKMGTLPKLVESMCFQSGELDGIFLDVLLTTYQSFTSSSLLLNSIIQWFERLSENEMTSQKENCKRSIKHALHLWMVKFGVDFYDPPLFPALVSLHSFASNHFPGTELCATAEEKLDIFIKSDVEATKQTLANLGVESISGVIDDICSSHHPILIPPLDIFIIPSSYFAEQLTYIDAKLFCDVMPRHCLGSIWSRRSDKKLSFLARPYSVLVTVEQFNAVSYRVISTILKWPYAGLSCRVAIVEKWITIAQECRRLKNFSSLKAILAGLQSHPVFRLKKIWQAISKEKADTFKELAAIFSEDDNQALWREILSKEGTSKISETSSSYSKSLSNKTANNKLSSIFNGNRINKCAEIAAATRVIPSVQGTVPYLGTFLTDLTMLDTAFQDVDPDTGMINFDKKRKEFEVLAQIRMLQSTCNFYKITPDPSFLDWFYGIRTYDENESHELSLEIEPSQDTLSKEKNKGHKKNMSLGYFTVKRHNMMFGDDDDDDNNDCVDNNSTDRKIAHSLKEIPALSKILSSQLDTLSFISTRTTMSDVTHRRSTSNLLNGSDQIQVKVELMSAQSHVTNFYKSILITNQDHVLSVMKKIFTKFNVDANPDDFYLCQKLENNREIELPEKGNLFYAIKTSSEVRLIVRPKSDGRLKNKLKSRGISALPWNRTKRNSDGGRLTRIFNSMVSLA